MAMDDKPLVGIIMGSDSDLPVMQEAEKILKEFNVSVETRIVSAHRTPDEMVNYAKTAEGRGLKVIIAGAGGAAHLPGMTASYTSLPTIGVPITTKALDGLDSLASIQQMPPGVPVATVAINGAKNAGLLAIEILGTVDPNLRQKIKDYKDRMRIEVAEKNEKLTEKGSEKYLEEKSH